jgi:hypothetical protein
MTTNQRIRRAAAILAGLVVTTAGLAAGGSTAFAQIVPPGGTGAGPALVPVAPATRTVVVGACPAGRSP